MEFRYDRLNNFRNIHGEMEKLLDYFGNSKPPSAHFSRIWGPAIDIYETDTEMIVVVELAGVKRNEIEIAIDGNTLIIRGERREFTQRGKRNYYQMEIQRGPFESTILLPAAVDPDSEKIRASYDDGLLEIALTKIFTSQIIRVNTVIFRKF